MRITHPKRICLAAVLGAAFGATLMSPAMASSHREAPFITTAPKVDGTDFYMFSSYDPKRPGFTTLIANYQPLEAPAGAPNYFQMDPNALYEIHIDNNGDGKEDLTFQFRFTNTNSDYKLNVGGKQVSVALQTTNSGDVSSVNSPSLNTRETYTIKMVKGDRRSGAVSDITNAASGSAVFDKPADNIGAKTISDYASYAGKHVHTISIPGCPTPGRVFVGQRKDPFVVNLGQFFDNYNIGLPAVQLGAGAESAAADTLAGSNTTSIELELPTACLTAGGEPVIGGWTTASLRQGRLLNPTPRTSAASKEGGAWVQVSRLGMPLVNELIIGLKDKDHFNASKPINDKQFIDYVTNPTYTAVVEQLFKGATNGAVVAPTNFPRNDLVATFLTGIKNVNQPAKVVASEMLRLNTATPPTPVGSQKRLGVIGGDSAGFPNGRRPGDDIVDIVLRVAMGRLCAITGASDALAVGCAAKDAPAGVLDFTDGAFLDETSFDPTFPYLRTPLAGSMGKGAAK